jgi:uncharacterized glyoxalase superfamily protein PhnB
MDDMAVIAVEAGLVSADRKVVEFLVFTFGFEELPVLDFPVGRLYRLQAGSAVLKVLVPVDRPVRRDVEPPYASSGVSYLTIRVSAFDAVIARVAESGGTIVSPPQELERGPRLAMVSDPDGSLIEVIEGPASS